MANPKQLYPPKPMSLEGRNSAYSPLKLNLFLSQALEMLNNNTILVLVLCLIYRQNFSD